MAFVVSAGQMAQLDAPLAPAFASVRLSDDVSHDYATLWRTQPQVRTVVTFLARNIAQLGLHVYERTSDTDRTRVTDHPLARLIARPNPWTTRYRLVNSLINDLATYDNAIWLKQRQADGQPAVVRVRPQWVDPIGGTWFAAEAYRIRGSRGERTVPADQVVHFRGHNPADDRWGVSPIETLRTMLSEEFHAAHYREQMWRNGARASGYLTRPGTAPEWSDAARTRFRASWRAQYSGSGAQAGGTPILEDGMAFVPASFTPEDAQYIEARKLTREEVAAAYFIPPPMVGILEHATFSNISEQHKMLYQDTLGPWLQMIVEELALQLLPDLDPSGEVYAEFNLAEKLRGSFEEQATQMQTAIGAPWLTRNEGRARMNLPALDGGDDLVVPLNVLIGGQASPRDSAPTGALAAPVRSFKAYVDETVVDKTRATLERFFDRQGRVLASLAGGTGLSWDAERWDAELAADLFAVNALIATQAGRKAMESLGFDPDEWDGDRVLAWLQANASGVAVGINRRTRQEVEQAVADDQDDDPAAAVRQTFAGAIAGRALQIAATQATAISGFATTESTRQVGATATKTWRTRSVKPRPSHARMDGQTVPVGELFSNSARWPGDSTLSDDERAGCTCELTITVEA